MAKHLHFLDANGVQRNIAEGTVVHDGEVAQYVSCVGLRGVTTALVQPAATQDAVYKLFQRIGAVGCSNMRCYFHVVGYGDADRVNGVNNKIEFVKNGNVVYTVNKGNNSAIGRVMRGVILI